MSEFVKTKKEFNKKPFNGNKDIKEGSEFILDIKRLGIACRRKATTVSFRVSHSASSPAVVRPMWP